MKKNIAKGLAGFLALLLLAGLLPAAAAAEGEGNAPVSEITSEIVPDAAGSDGDAAANNPAQTPPSSTNADPADTSGENAAGAGGSQVDVDSSAGTIVPMGFEDPASEGPKGQLRLVIQRPGEGAPPIEVVLAPDERDGVYFWTLPDGTSETDGRVQGLKALLPYYDFTGWNVEEMRATKEELEAEEAQKKAENPAYQEHALPPYAANFELSVDLLEWLTGKDLSDDDTITLSLVPALQEKPTAAVNWFLSPDSTEPWQTTNVTVGHALSGQDITEKNYIPANPSPENDPAWTALSDEEKKVQVGGVFEGWTVKGSDTSLNPDYTVTDTDVPAGLSFVANFGPMRKVSGLTEEEMKAVLASITIGLMPDDKEVLTTGSDGRGSANMTAGFSLHDGVVLRNVVFTFRSSLEYGKGLLHFVQSTGNDSFMMEVLEEDTATGESLMQITVYEVDISDKGGSEVSGLLAFSYYFENEITKPGTVAQVELVSVACETAKITYDNSDTTEGSPADLRKFSIAATANSPWIFSDKQLNISPSTNSTYYIIAGDGSTMNTGDEIHKVPANNIYNGQTTDDTKPYQFYTREFGLPAASQRTISFATEALFANNGYYPASELDFTISYKSKSNLPDPLVALLKDKTAGLPVGGNDASIQKVIDLYFNEFKITDQNNASLLANTDITISYKSNRELLFHFHIKDMDVATKIVRGSFKNLRITLDKVVDDIVPLSSVNEYTGFDVSFTPDSAAAIAAGNLTSFSSYPYATKDGDIIKKTPIDGRQSASVTLQMYRYSSNYYLPHLDSNYQLSNFMNRPIPFYYNPGGETPGNDKFDYGLSGASTRNYMAVNNLPGETEGKIIPMNRQWFSMSYYNDSTLYLDTKLDCFITSESAMEEPFSGATIDTKTSDLATNSSPRSYDLRNKTEINRLRGSGWVADEMDLIAFRLPSVGNSTTYTIRVTYANGDIDDLVDGVIPANNARLRYLDGTSNQYVALKDGAGATIKDLQYIYSKKNPNTYNVGTFASYTSDSIVIIRQMQVMYQLKDTFLNAPTVQEIIKKEQVKQSLGNDTLPNYISLPYQGYAGVEYGVTNRATGQVISSAFQVRLVNEYMDGNKTVTNQTRPGNASGQDFRPGDKLRFTLNLRMDGSAVGTGGHDYLEIVDVPNSNLAFDRSEMNVEIVVRHVVGKSEADAKSTAILDIPGGVTGTTKKGSDGRWQTTYNPTAEQINDVFDRLQGPSSPNTGDLNDTQLSADNIQFYRFKNHVSVGDEITIRYTAKVADSAAPNSSIKNNIYTRTYGQNGTPPPWKSHGGTNGTVVPKGSDATVNISTYAIGKRDASNNIIPTGNRDFYNKQQYWAKITGRIFNTGSSLYNPEFVIQLPQYAKADYNHPAGTLFDVNTITNGVPTAIEADKYTLTYYDNSGNIVELKNAAHPENVLLALNESNSSKIKYVKVAFNNLMLDASKEMSVSFYLPQISFVSDPVYNSDWSRVYEYAYLAGYDSSNQRQNVYVKDGYSDAKCNYNMSFATIIDKAFVGSVKPASSFSYIRGYGTDFYAHYNTSRSTIQLTSQIRDSSRGYVVPGGKVDYKLQLSNIIFDSSIQEATHRPPLLDLFYVQIVLPPGYEMLEDDLDNLVITLPIRDSATPKTLVSGLDFEYTTSWGVLNNDEQQLVTLRFKAGLGIPYGKTMEAKIPATYVDATATLGDKTVDNARAYASHYYSRHFTNISNSTSVSPNPTSYGYPANDIWNTGLDFKRDYNLPEGEYKTASDSMIYRYSYYTDTRSGRNGPTIGLQKGILLKDETEMRTATTGVDNAAKGNWITWQLRLFNDAKAETSLREFEVVDILPSGIFYRDPELPAHKADDTSKGIVRDPNIYIKPTEITTNQAGQQVLIWRFGPGKIEKTLQAGNTMDLCFDVTLNADDSGYRTNRAYIIPNKTTQPITIGSKKPNDRQGDYGKFVAEDLASIDLQRDDYSYITATGNAVMAEQEIQLLNSVGAVGIMELKTTGPGGETTVVTSSRTPSIVHQSKRGEEITYTFSLENTSTYKATYNGAYLFDVLPTPGDRYTQTDRPRGSSWALDMIGTDTNNLAKAFTVEDTTGVVNASNYTLYYSTTAPRDAAELQNFDAGTTLWKNASDWTGENIAAFCVYYHGDINKGDTVSVTWKMKVPDNLDPTMVDKYANNSGSFMFNCTQNGKNFQFAAEPDKVGVTVRRNENLGVEVLKTVDDPTMAPKVTVNPGGGTTTTYPEKTFYFRLLRDNGTAFVPHVFRSGIEHFDHGIVDIQEKGSSVTDGDLTINDTTGVFAITAKADENEHGGTILGLPDGTYKVEELSKGYYVTIGEDQVKIGFGSGQPEVEKATIHIANQRNFNLEVNKTLADDRLANNDESTFYFRLSRNNGLLGSFKTHSFTDGREEFGEGVVSIQAKGDTYTDPDTAFAISDTKGVFAIKAKAGATVGGIISNLPGGIYKIQELNTGDYTISGDNNVEIALGKASSTNPNQMVTTGKAEITNTYVTPPAPSSSSTADSSSSSVVPDSSSSSVIPDSSSSSDATTSSEAPPASSQTPPPPPPASSESSSVAPPAPSRSTAPSSSRPTPSSGTSTVPVISGEINPGGNTPTDPGGTVVPDPTVPGGGTGGGGGAGGGTSGGTTDNITPEAQVRLDNQSGNLISDLLDGNVPLGNFAHQAAWSLLSLILSLISLVIAVVAFIKLIFHRRNSRSKTLASKDDMHYHAQDTTAEPEPKQIGRRSLGMRILTILSGLLPGILFLIFDDLTQPVMFINKFTPIVIIATLIHAIIFAGLIFFKRYQDDESEQDDDFGQTDQHAPVKF